MSYVPYELADSALADIDDIWLHIAIDNEGAANQFIDQIWDKFPLIATQPRMGAERPDIAPDARAFVFRDYLILYRLKGSSIEIVRVVHGMQKLEELF